MTKYSQLATFQNQHLMLYYVVQLVKPGAQPVEQLSLLLSLYSASGFNQLNFLFNLLQLNRLSFEA